MTAAPLALFAILAYQARDGTISRWDREAVGYFDRHYYDLGALRRVAEAVVQLGLIAGAAIALVAVAILAARGLRRQALFLGVAVAGPIVLTPLLKWLVGRPQIGASPESDYSFPSGNAMISSAFLTALFLLLPQFRRAAAAPAFVLSALYGGALVLLLWHYPSDVLAGWCIALAWVAGVWVALGAPVVPDLASGAGFPASVKPRSPLFPPGGRLGGPLS